MDNKDFLKGKTMNLYNDFVRDLRYDDKYPVLQKVSEYDGQEIVKLTCTQHSELLFSEEESRRITKDWVEFLKSKELNFKEVQICTKTPQNIFDAICMQSSIESLRIKWLSCKDLSAISQLKNLKKLFIESGTSIENISPISELENLEVLILGSTKKVKNYNSLGKLTKLKVFGVCSYQIRDDVMEMDSIDFIEKLTNLEYLELWNVRIGNGKKQHILKTGEMIHRRK